MLMINSSRIDGVTKIVMQGLGVKKDVQRARALYAEKSDTSELAREMLQKIDAGDV